MQNKAECAVYIREMNSFDWLRVAEIYTQAVEKGISTFQRSCPDFESWDKSHLQRCRYVIEINDRVVGWCALSPTSSRPVYSGVAEVSIYLDSDHCGKGYGKQLIAYLCNESVKYGYYSLYAVVFQINTASIRLFEVCGFRTIGYREKIAKDIFGLWQNTVLLEKRAEEK